VFICLDQQDQYNKEVSHLRKSTEECSGERKQKAENGPLARKQNKAKQTNKQKSKTIN